ncbi:MAG: hypothetical protein KIT57_16850 [Blastocatellales bacterium]|nr:hypothetical protein [Blastocatellales bacterium]
MKSVIINLSACLISLAYLFILSEQYTTSRMMMTTYAPMQPQRDISINMQDVYAAQVLEFLAKEYNIPVGTEIARSTKNVDSDSKISINVLQKPLVFALDAIVHADPRYRWEINDGVVNLLPQDEFDSLLKVRVQVFQISNLNRLETKRAIGNLPEIRAKLKSLGLEFGPLGLWPQNKPDSLRLSLNLHNTTLKEILNEIAKTTRFWCISQFGESFLIQI